VLHTERAGSGDPVVLVHGFTQSSRSWGEIAEVLSEGHEVVAIDAPGHGASASVSADLAAGADMMVEAAPPKADWIGYSMGGRFALHVALRHPRSVRKLVLVSTTAGIDDPEQRRARRESDEKLADQVGRDGLEEFVKAWLRQPLFASLPETAARIDDRLTGTASGLADSLRLAGAGTQEPLWDRLGSLGMPVLVVAGSLDAKYTALAQRLVDGVGANADLAIIAGAGHACHLERPTEFLAVVGRFLART
jgi:2-succinyl-6-hydroxy-2,4-cyclohexadiene-1-carboxylate synthase